MADGKCLKVLRADRVYLIGRKTTADIVINHPSISASHCRIQLYEDDVRVEEVVEKDSASALPLPVVVKPGDYDDSEPRAKPRPSTKVKPRLAITDSSSNGTWLYSKSQYRSVRSKLSQEDASENDSLTESLTQSQDFFPLDSKSSEQTPRPKRLQRDEQTELHIGDFTGAVAPLFQWGGELLI